MTTPITKINAASTAIDKASQALREATSALRQARDLMIPPTGTDATLQEIIVGAAMRAADAGQPISRRKSPAQWVFAEIATAAARRINLAAIRDCLENEQHRVNSRVIYRRHDPHGRGLPAGWIRKFSEAKE